MEDKRKCFRRLFQMNGATTLKLRLPSSVAVLGTTRSPRSTEGSAREILHRYVNVLEKCRTGTSNTAKCKECSLNRIDCFLQYTGFCNCFLNLIVLHLRMMRTFYLYFSLVIFTVMCGLCARLLLLIINKLGRERVQACTR